MLIALSLLRFVFFSIQNRKLEDRELRLSRSLDLLLLHRRHALGSLGWSRHLLVLGSRSVTLVLVLLLLSLERRSLLILLVRSSLLIMVVLVGLLLTERLENKTYPFIKLASCIMTLLTWFC